MMRVIYALFGCAFLVTQGVVAADDRANHRTKNLNFDSAAGDIIDLGIYDPAGFPPPNVYTLAMLYGEEGSYAAQIGADFALGYANRLAFDLGYSHSPLALANLSTYRGGIGFDHDFDPVGITLGYQYWGDRDRIESHALRGSIYFHKGLGRVAFTYEHKNIDLAFDVPAGARGFVANSRSATSQGYGFSGRLNTEQVDFYVNGMNYDYDVELARLGSLIDISRVPPGQRAELLGRINGFLFNLGRLNASSLTLANSFLDYNVAAGVDIPIREHALNVELARDAAATDGLVLDTVSVGFTQAAGNFDIEYRLGASKGDNVESSFFGGVTLYWYR
jgi:hypothetical protein